MIRLRPSPAELLEELKHQKAAAQAAFHHGGVKYQADPASLSAVLARAGVCNPTDTVRWISADNKQVTLRGSEFIDLAVSMARYVDEVMATYAGLRGRIEAGEIVDPENWENN